MARAPRRHLNTPARLTPVQPLARTDGPHHATKPGPGPETARKPPRAVMTQLRPMLPGCQVPPRWARRRAIRRPAGPLLRLMRQALHAQAQPRTPSSRPHRYREQPRVRGELRGIIATLQTGTQTAGTGASSTSHPTECRRARHDRSDRREQRATAKRDITAARSDRRRTHQESPCAATQSRCPPRPAACRPVARISGPSSV